MRQSSVATSCPNVSRSVAPAGSHWPASSGSAPGQSMTGEHNCNDESPTQSPPVADRHHVINRSRIFNARLPLGPSNCQDLLTDPYSTDPYSTRMSQRRNRVTNPLFLFSLRSTNLCGCPIHPRSRKFPHRRRRPIVAVGLASIIGVN